MIKHILFIAFTIVILFSDKLNALNVKEGITKIAEKAEKIKNNLHENGKVCLTPGCILAASDMRKKMDTNVDPCDDFYKFSCGQFLEETRIPDDEIFVNTFSIVGDLLQEQLRTIITSPIDANEIEPFKMVKKLYLACMNESYIEERGLKLLTDLHDQVMGGWPVIKTDWDDSKWSWQNAVKNLHHNGYSTDFILDFSVSTDLKNSTRRIIDIDQTDFGLNIEYLLKGFDDPIVKAYCSYQVDVAVMFGADKQRAEKDMKEALEFEIELAKISLTNDKRRDAEAFYNPITIKDLNIKHPYINWLEYFNNILPESVQIDENEVILIYVPSFYDKLGELIEKTPKRTIANYLTWRMTDYSIKYLTKALRKRQLKYNAAISGQEEEEPRTKECIDLTSATLSTALSAAYVRKYFKEDSKANALKMVNSIKEEFEKILMKVPWMSEKTRELALEKIKAMHTHIGHPSELTDDNKLNDYYKKATVNEEKYLESILSINRFDTERDFKKLRERVNKTDWITHSKQAQVNALYSSVENSIKFPAGILQGQFYNIDRPQYMNYAAIGSIIGHEITHGFDDRGRQFDADGNLVDWWEDDTKKAYLEKVQCIIEQYGNYTEPTTEMKLNGVKTQGENIADNGGIKEAYLAYKNYEKQNGAEGTLPDLDFTTNQLFFINYAQTWCSAYRPATLRAIIIALNHAPSGYRVIGPLNNLKEFLQEFNCPLGSPMNPINKCEVW